MNDAMNNIRRFNTPNPLSIITLDISPDSKLLVVGQPGDANSKLVLSLWSLDEYRSVATLIRADGGISLAARFSPNGSLLAYSDAHQNLILYDLKIGTVRHQAFLLPGTEWITFAWNRNRLLAGGDQTLVWDVDSKEIIWVLPVNNTLESHSASVPCCAISADGKLVAASGVEKGHIIIYDAESGQVVNKLDKTMDIARSIAFDPGGKMLAAISTTGSVGLWSLQNGEPILPDLLNMKTDYYWCVRFHPNGEYVGFGLWSGFVELIRIKDGKYLINQDTPVHTGRVRDLAFTRDGTQMITGGEDGVILIWNIE
jgi:WD40 repeat protein